MFSKRIVLAVIIMAFGFSQSMYAQCGSHKKARQTSYGQHQTKATIVDIAVGSNIHTTLVAALKAGDLVGALSGDGPFTVFAPTDVAFDKLEDGTVATLLKPESKGALQEILKYHVVSGNFTASDVLTAIKRSGGTFTIKTLAGDNLEAFTKSDKVYLRDGQGRIAQVTAYDLTGTNGVIHVIDEVLLP